MCELLFLSLLFLVLPFQYFSSYITTFLPYTEWDQHTERKRERASVCACVQSCNNQLEPFIQWCILSACMCDMRACVWNEIKSSEWVTELSLSLVHICFWRNTNNNNDGDGANTIKWDKKIYVHLNFCESERKETAAAAAAERTTGSTFNEIFYKINEWNERMNE